ncbi:MAG: hypothetical protein ACO1SV_18855 [Fimbriimonas sp.]
MILLPLLAVAGTRVLMIGNSHTGANNLPEMVRTILSADSKLGAVTVETRGGAFLEDLARQPGIENLIRGGRWDFIVLQAAKVSSSHKYRYSQTGGIALAKAAKTSGAKTLLFVEWPRKGVKETEFIQNVYGEIAAAAKVDLIPVGRGFDAILAKQPQAPLWAADGNHASPMGSALAAYTIACWIRNDDANLPTLRVPGVPSEAMKSLAGVASATWRRYR